MRVFGVACACAAQFLPPLDLTTALVLCVLCCSRRPLLFLPVCQRDATELLFFLRARKVLLSCVCGPLLPTTCAPSLCICVLYLPVLYVYIEEERVNLLSGPFNYSYDGERATLKPCLLYSLLCGFA